MRAMSREMLLGTTPFATIAEAIERDWRALARGEQLAPSDDFWSIWIYLAGRGAGKTRSGAEYIRERVETGQCGRIALIAPTAADARDVMVEGESGLLAIAPNGFRPTFSPSLRRVTWPNGAIATLFSSEEPDRLRGPQHDALWADELAAWKNAQDVWDMAQFGLRLGKRPRVVVTTTPKPIPLLKALLKREGQDVVVTRGRTADNAANLAPTFLSSIVSRYQSTRLGRQELDAEMLEDTPGALWSLSLLEENRRDKAALPPMRRIVVAIDPAVSTGEDADETGIVVCGLGVDGKGYLIEDASGKLAPIEWARRAVGLYRHYGADRIIAEANQGGELVEQTIRTVDRSASYKGVHASRGKITRAEPIAALAEQHNIMHAGVFPELEDQLVSFAGGTGKSPDRLDAYVWGFTELMLGVTNTGWLDYMKSEVKALAADEERNVRLVAPLGIGAVQAFGGRHVNVPANRIVELTEEEATPLLRAGWCRSE
jgi:predicted phage terminase large subunit-like protein